MAIPRAQMPDWRAYKEAYSGDFLGSFLKGATSGALRAAKLRREMAESDREHKLKTEKFKADEREKLYKHGREKKKLKIDEMRAKNTKAYYDANAEHQTWIRKDGDARREIKERADKISEDVAKGHLRARNIEISLKPFLKKLDMIKNRVKETKKKKEQAAKNLVDATAGQIFSELMAVWNENKEGPKPNMTQIKGSLRQQLDETGELTSETWGRGFDEIHQGVMGKMGIPGEAGSPSKEQMLIELQRVAANNPEALRMLEQNKDNEAWLREAYAGLSSEVK